MVTLQEQPREPELPKTLLRREPYRAWYEPCSSHAKFEICRLLFATVDLRDRLLLSVNVVHN